jgi:hypothetical protein
MPSTALVRAIPEVEYELMLVDAIVTDDATAEIIRDTGTRLTIRIPGGLLPVHLTVDPPGAARLVHLLAGYADRAQVTGLVPDPPVRRPVPG